MRSASDARHQSLVERKHLANPVAVVLNQKNKKKNDVVANKGSYEAVGEISGSLFHTREGFFGTPTDKK